MNKALTITINMKTVIMVIELINKFCYKENWKIKNQICGKGKGGAFSLFPYHNIYVKCSHPTHKKNPPDKNFHLITD